MATMTAREANQSFSKLLKAAENGEEVVITRRGKPVAKLVAIEAETVEQQARRQAEREEALEFFRKGIKGGVVVPWNREELYLDRIDRGQSEGLEDDERE